MQYRIRKTNEIVDVVCYSGCSYVKTEQDYVCYYDSKGNKVIGKGLSLIWDFEPIDETQNFDWQSFRAKAAKDILCSVILTFEAKDPFDKALDNAINNSIKAADKLISKLKEKEEK